MEPKKSKWFNTTNENDFMRFLESYKKKENEKSRNCKTIEEALKAFGN